MDGPDGQRASSSAWAALDIGYDDFIRTTEPRHHAAVQHFLQRIYDNGYIELGTYSGLYCISCEDYYTEDQLVDGCCPVHGRPVVEMEEENYFFKLSEFEDRLLEWYEAHPDAVRPPAKRNEALGFIRGGLDDISITRTSFRWGVPVPWDDGHVFYVWYDALDQLPHGRRIRPATERFAALVAGRPPPHRQGHPEVPLRLVARHVHGRGYRAAAGGVRARLPAGRRGAAVQDAAGPGRRRGRGGRCD